MPRSRPPYPLVSKQYVADWAGRAAGEPRRSPPTHPLIGRLRTGVKPTCAPPARPTPRSSWRATSRACRLTHARSSD